MPKKSSKPKTFSLHWGKGIIEEEAQIVTQYHRPTIQLLHFLEGDAAGSYSLRFCYYDHHGRFQRSPMMMDTAELKDFRDSLKHTPKLRKFLAKMFAA
jgi:hypothetical protein